MGSSRQLTFLFCKRKLEPIRKILEFQVQSSPIYSSSKAISCCTPILRAGLYLGLDWGPTQTLQISTKRMVWFFQIGPDSFILGPNWNFNISFMASYVALFCRQNVWALLIPLGQGFPLPEIPTWAHIETPIGGQIEEQSRPPSGEPQTSGLLACLHKALNFLLYFFYQNKKIKNRNFNK